MAVRRDGFISFNPLAPGVGPKIYEGTRLAPNVGPVSADGLQGYAARDRRLAVKRNALLAYMQGGQQGKYAGAGYLRKAGG